ncbi:HPr-rel-A system PqqD family peptide chaperone [Sphingomonas sp. PL-96]|uniref:HPr-rel-A system PqqD family peptide chaperone n=1 Tax=Sphingomonas sp. PL-96 TaxID=2887201 RepID=UPI001E56ACF5|nr:HPr-rel-A system PqqD family peptide chaperone [Sphingomonas sp. PL-96]MCC2975497.1 HPr-rel-A system PqqD family peptide chaperone [Sphingomonas sp. PL-96]
MAAAEAGLVRYHAPPAGVLRLVSLDELTALYHRASGQTHLVAAPVPEILEALGGAPATLPELLARLAARYDLADADPDALEARLVELVSLGLVRRG